MKISQLASRVSQETGLNAAQAVDAVHAILNVISGELREQSTFYLYGFGTFRIVERKARRGRNPRTGEALEIPARKGLRWSASRSFLRAAGVLPPGRRSGKAARKKEVAEAESFLTQTGALLGGGVAIEAPDLPLEPPTAPEISFGFEMETPGMMVEVPAPETEVEAAPTPPPSEAPSAPAPAPAPSASAPAVAEDPLVQRARRMAKVNVDDLFLYFGNQITEALQAGRNPEEVVEDQLQEARKTLRRRVGDALADKTDFIGEEFRKRLETIKSG
jgi:DNA-binding protein HU-beta